MLKAKENLLIYLDSILCEEYEKSSQFIQRELEEISEEFLFLFRRRLGKQNRIRERSLTHRKFAKNTD